MITDENEYVEEIAYTRYLYDRYEVKKSLFISIIQRKTEDALFWTYELYFSGWEDIVFTYMLLITDSIFNHIDGLYVYLETQYEHWRTTKNTLIIGNCISMLCTLDYSLITFVKYYYDVDIHKMVRYKTLYPKPTLTFLTDNDIDKKYKTIVNNQEPNIVLSQLDNHSIHHEYDELFRTENKMTCDMYDSWIMYAWKAPIWMSRIREYDGVYDTESNNVIFTDDKKKELFYHTWDFKIQKQNAEIQQRYYKTSKTEVEQMNLSSFLKNFGYSVNRSKKKLIVKNNNNPIRNKSSESK